MKYENEPINEELEAECWHEGIIANYKKLTREQALVLCGEKMIENLLKFWRRELFPNCLLKNMAASDEEIRKMLGSDNNDADDKGKKCEGDKAEKYEKGTDGCSVQHEDTQSSLNNCKGVMKMEANIQAKLDNYLELLNALKAKTLNELTAVYILQEISKDVRTEQIREEREAKNVEPATEKQKKFMKKLGMDFPKNATKQEASVMIDEELSRNGNGE